MDAKPITRTIVRDDAEERVEYDSKADETYHYRKDYLLNHTGLHQGRKLFLYRRYLFSMVLTYSHRGQSTSPPVQDIPSDCAGVACTVTPEIRSLGHGLINPDQRSIS